MRENREKYCQMGKVCYLRSVTEFEVRKNGDISGFFCTTLWLILLCGVGSLGCPSYTATFDNTAVTESCDSANFWPNSNDSISILDSSDEYAEEVEEGDETHSAQSQNHLSIPNGVTGYFSKFHPVSISFQKRYLLFCNLKLDC